MYWYTPPWFSGLFFSFFFFLFLLLVVFPGCRVVCSSWAHPPPHVSRMSCSSPDDGRKHACLSVSCLLSDGQAVRSLGPVVLEALRPSGIFPSSLLASRFSRYCPRSSHLALLLQSSI
ncbi:hypothetical protein IWZ03DRAFT_195618 [Phyllosticta citriasiana]|uniref:Secreted protein n=1 Tax=Phyllosticta citriasiana TaxID=595635 RepID=A0ABR1KN63_9PEZI